MCAHPRTAGVTFNSIGRIKGIVRYNVVNFYCVLTKEERIEERTEEVTEEREREGGEVAEK